jgi:hypothetical protein
MKLRNSHQKHRTDRFISKQNIKKDFNLQNSRIPQKVQMPISLPKNAQPISHPHQVAQQLHLKTGLLHQIPQNRHHHTSPKFAQFREIRPRRQLVTLLILKIEPKQQKHPKFQTKQHKDSQRYQLMVEPNIILSFQNRAENQVKQHREHDGQIEHVQPEDNLEVQNGLVSLQFVDHAFVVEVQKSGQFDCHQNCDDYEHAES